MDRPDGQMESAFFVKRERKNSFRYVLKLPLRSKDKNVSFISIKWGSTVWKAMNFDHKTGASMFIAFNYWLKTVIRIFINYLEGEF